ncbi:MAG: peptidoglycan DD-metalloendopeptidase family protein [candidate division Zixibacteria bacterium]|nr:peptidoglycan DD-metalloendopeptidase family protein [candidate division Zixibacteria bacterium]
MLKKKLTFMLIPDSLGVSKQLSIPTLLIYGVVAAVAVLLFASFYLSSIYFSDKVNETELEQLRAENERLKEKYDQMRWNLAEVEDRYITLVEKEIKIRSLFDLPEVASEERQLGIGGPGALNAAQFSQTEMTAYSTESEVDHLLRLSEFELEKYSEVEGALEGVKARLEHTPSIWPTKGWLSRGYGMKYDPFTGYKRMHRGIDIANHTGTPIVTTAAGKVVQVKTDVNMGKYIVVDHGYGFRTRYGHLSKTQAKVGQKVQRGEVIGLMGSTGYSTGPHLHYEVIRNGKFFNPTKYILNDMN